jgi:nicotinate-nucleotide--dimethylbenzimidazole phosphoribosyltransferase
MKAPDSIDEISKILSDLPPADEAAAAETQARDATLTKPPGALGRLEEIAVWLSAWQGKAPPSAEKPAVLVFAGNHGVAARGVSAFPADVTVQMVANFERGGAAVNQLSHVAGAAFKIVPLDLDTPTEDFTRAPAMSEDGFVAAFGAGWEAVPTPCDLLAIGEMGIGNTTAAAALCMALFGGDALDWTGPGTGVQGQALSAKGQVVQEGVALHRDAGQAPIDLLRRLGGREIAAMAGAILRARLENIPVLLDGYVCGAAAAVLHVAAPGALDHTLAGHTSAEPGHRKLLVELGKKPLLDLGMRLGEASGAALAINIVKAACACHTGMATFAEAGVSDG